MVAVDHLRPTLRQPADTVRPVRRWPPAALLVLILLLGLGVRLHGLDREPLGFHPARQYRSALIARALYLDRTVPPSDPARVEADAAAALQGHLEPEVMETAASYGYLLLGHETLLVPRLMAALLWLLGGVAIWQLLGRMTALAGRAAGLLLFVLLPLGVEGGRSFQPDALMVALMAWALLAAVRYREGPTATRLVSAGMAAGAAVFVKPMAMPMLGAAFVALQWSAHVGWRRVVNASTAAYGALAVALAAAYWFAGNGSIGSITYFVPSLIGQLSFYRSWLTIVDASIGLVFVGLAVAGTCLAYRAWRPLLVSLWVGYLIFGVAVDYRTATHTYYHLQLLVIVALGVGVLVDAVVARTSVMGLGRPARMGMATAAIVMSLVLVAAALRGPPNTAGSGGASPSVDRRIGALVGQGRAGVLTVTDDYGVSLAYYGHVSTVEYPSTADVTVMRLGGQHVPTVAETLALPIGASPPRWLAVTNMADWALLPALREYTSSHAALVASGPTWALYRLAPTPT